MKKDNGTHRIRKGILAVFMNLILIIFSLSCIFPILHVFAMSLSDSTAAMAGRTVRVLVEAAGRNEGTVNGRLDNNLVVEFKAPESLIGQWADVHITGSRAALLVGELAE